MIEIPTKILYIEDDPGSQRLVSRILEPKGYEVITADSGLEGIRKATAELPNMILIDINMGDLDGYEVTTRLRSENRLRETPIIALTANVLQGDKERALVAGCNGYLSKPIDIDEFPNQVDAYLGGLRETIPEAQQVNYLAKNAQQIAEHLEDKVKELEQAHAALQHLEKMKSNFIVLSAHELRTPLTSAYGYSRLLMMTEAIRNDVSGDQVKTFAEKIFASVSRLNEVVNDILNIALIESNTMGLDIQATSLEKVINAALVELDPLEKGRNLTINIDPPLGTLPKIEGDPELLQQVFFNLLSNAVKYTPDGGSILISSHAAVEYIDIRIQDTGIGIPSDEMPHIFERFHVVSDTSYHSSSKAEFMGGGMGIGLSIVKGILDAHDAKISVESTGVDGEGTTIYLKIPITYQEEKDQELQ